MTRAELIDWAVAHATGPMVSPVAVAVLRELLGDDWACRLLDATEKREPATGIIDADGNQSSATNYPESPDSSLDGWMEQCRLFPNPNSELSPGPMLPEICIEIRSSTDGSSDPLPKAFLEKVRLMLIARLYQWGKRYEDVIDECVKRMCEATITIIEHELKSRIERGWDY